MRLSQILWEEFGAGPFEWLRANRKPLTAEERDECLQAGAVWHHGLKGEATPAVWKAYGKDGKVVYITNTHRAYETAPTLKGAIHKYHSFIKGTA